MQKTVKGKLAFDCPVVRLYFGFTPTFDIEPKNKACNSRLILSLNIKFIHFHRSKNFLHRSCQSLHSPQQFQARVFDYPFQPPPEYPLS